MYKIKAPIWFVITNLTQNSIQKKKRACFIWLNLQICIICDKSMKQDMAKLENKGNQLDKLIFHHQ